MTARHCSFLILVSALVALALTGCGIDFEARQQQPGQECRFDEDCAEGLVCTQRRCRPVSSIDADIPDVDPSDAGSPDGDLPDTGEPDTGEPDTGEPDTGEPDTDEPDVDASPQICAEGDRICADEQTALRCDLADDGATVWVLDPCADNEFCAEDRGECLPREQAPCCEDGCGDDQICNECQCIDTDPTECNFQDQPCEVEGQVANGFICTEFRDTGELTCLGICNTDRDNPSSSCPAPDTYCVSEPNEPNGVCLSNCEQGDRCASEDFGCVAYEHDGGFGLCIPNSDDEELGEDCDEDEPFSCADGALCAEGTCRASCRPFGDYGDCTGGDVCLPVGEQTGVCVDPGPNADALQSRRCSDASPVCGEDALACVTTALTPTEPRCMRLCRVDGNDCRGRGPCFDITGANENIGVCLSLGGG